MCKDPGMGPNLKMYIIQMVATSTLPGLRANPSNPEFTWASVASEINFSYFCQTKNFPGLIDRWLTNRESRPLLLLAFNLTAAQFKNKWPPDGFNWVDPSRDLYATAIGHLLPKLSNISP